MSCSTIVPFRFGNLFQPQVPLVIYFNPNRLAIPPLEIRSLRPSPMHTPAVLRRFRLSWHLLHAHILWPCRGAEALQRLWFSGDQWRTLPAKNAAFPSKHEPGDNWRTLHLRRSSPEPMTWTVKPKTYFLGSIFSNAKMEKIESSTELGIPKPPSAEGYAGR